LPSEAPLIFWRRFVWQTLRAHALAIGPILRLWYWTRAAARDAAARGYTDLGLTTVSDEDETKLDLVGATAGGRAAAAHAKHVADVTATAPDKVAAAALPRGVRPGVAASMSA
jgi:hypothetical protein